MERCAINGAAATYAGRCTEFVPTGCCGESSATGRNACAEPYASYRRADAAERMGARRDGERDDRNCECDLSASSQLPVTMGYVPLQKWCNTYDTQTALCRGSLFPELDKPFLGSRGERYVR